MSNSRVDYGSSAGDVSRVLESLERQSFVGRLWAKDPTIWRQASADGVKEVINRLGWLDVMPSMLGQLGKISDLLAKVEEKGFEHFVVLGMGGSSLSPEVSSLVFGDQPGCRKLHVLDSTVPGAVLKIRNAIVPEKTLFVVAMKSGSTVETNSSFRYFYDIVKTGDNFVAITDEGTALDKLADDKGFLAKFINPSDIGGRFSALSFFGLVPAALVGIGLTKLLGRASEMADQCKPGVPVADNPGLVLGALLAEHALQGRDKLTLILPQEIASFGYWVEQLVAESTGKMGRGIVPVEGESLAGPDAYGADRVFAYIRLNAQTDASLDAQVAALEAAGRPVIRMEMQDVYDLGAQYYLWEMATAVACALLGVNAFDQPNVQESKTNTGALLTSFEQTGSLAQDEPIIVSDGISLYCDSLIKAEMDAITSGGNVSDYVNAFVGLHQPMNYFALMAFVQPTDAVAVLLDEMRTILRDKFLSATTLGYGPRFLHSTGQLHKGGANNGIFIQFTADDAQDVDIPEVPYSFSTLKNAQALGDSQALVEKGRPFMRIHLGRDIEDGLREVIEMLRG